MDLLLVTHKGRLTARAGQGGWNKIEAAIDDYLDGLGSKGITAGLELLDWVVAEQPGADDQILLDQRSIKAALGDLSANRSNHYLLILGGDDVVPFFRIKDASDDNVLDPFIFSDSYYADFTENDQDHYPELAVGRMPDGGQDEGKLLVSQLARARQLHQAGGVSPRKSAGFAAKVWRAASEATYERIGDPATLLLSPPLERDSFQANLLSGNTVLFFNVHGHRTLPRWYGDERILGFPRQPELIDDGIMSQAQMADAVVFCEACHGAAIQPNRTPQDSLALCALQQGAAAFFGCTVKSYAVTLPDGAIHTESGIDQLFNYLIHQVIRRKERFGEALRDAKGYYRYNSAYDEKNILGSVLYGDPMLRVRDAQ